MRIVFVRHGQTTFNLESRYQGHTDSKLSQLGYLQAERVAERLKDCNIAAIYASDLSRARETAEIIAKYHNLPVITNDSLRECKFGDWEGLTVTQIREKYPELWENYGKDSITYRAPGGERLEELCSRVAAFVDCIAKKHPNDTVVVAAHGGTIHAFFAHALGAGLEVFRKIRSENASLTIFYIDSHNRWVVETLNDTCHLRGLESKAGHSESEVPAGNK